MIDYFTVEKLIVENARAGYYKTATKCVMGTNFAQVQDARGKALSTLHREDAPIFLLRDLRQSVRQ